MVRMGQPLAIAVAACVLAMGTFAVAEEPAQDDRAVVAHVLNRLAFGPRPGQVEAVVAEGWQAWARRQLDRASIDDDAVERQVSKRFPALRMDLGELMATYRPPYENDPPTMTDVQHRNELRYQIRRELQHAVLHRAIHSERQFEQVILDFWRNHFNVDQNKDDVGYFATHYEDHVLRRYAFGNFDDLLLATATHPAMLIYLDNDVSQKPLSDREQKLMQRFEGKRYTPRTVLALERQRGLNENYARELMELHTLGVDNGYTQHDVVDLARVLTGWTVGRTYDDAGRPVDFGFRFRDDVHDTGPKRILGMQLRSSDDERAGVAVIRRLANHPMTARFISLKLCRYLVCDDPPEDLVSMATNVFLETTGNLPKVYEAIIFSDAFTAPEHRQVKYKTPFEFVVSAMRATDSTVNNYGAITQRLRRMGQPIYGCEDPTGYDDRAERWLDPGSLVARWEFALALSAGELEHVSTPTLDEPWRLLATPPDDELRAMFLRAEDKQRLGLVLGSPLFQLQ